VRRRVERWLNRIWYDGVPPPWWLRALEPVYRRLSATSRRTPANLPIPVVVVGNLTAGGSGKTPTVIALVEQLRDRGWRPGVISRGYGGRYRQAVLEVYPDSDPALVGDETVLLARRTGVPVAVARRRILAALHLAARGCDVLVSDDGLQHRELPRTVELLVVHGERRFGNQRLLPAGPMRETFDPARFPFIVVNGKAEAGEFPLRTRIGLVVGLGDPNLERDLDSFAGQRVHALAGIADPARFFAMLADVGLDTVPHPFPDHHRFLPDDLRFLRADPAPLLCTEKDAVKLAALRPPNAWVVPLESRLPAALLDAIEARLRAATPA
jgi:tetraacyldisaccharide 4'-kinase